MQVYLGAGYTRRWARTHWERQRKASSLQMRTFALHTNNTRRQCLLWVMMHIQCSSLPRTCWRGLRLWEDDVNGEWFPETGAGAVVIGDGSQIGSVAGRLGPDLDPCQLPAVQSGAVAGRSLVQSHQETPGWLPRPGRP